MTRRCKQIQVDQITLPPSPDEGTADLWNTTSNQKRRAKKLW